MTRPLDAAIAAIVQHDRCLVACHINPDGGSRNHESTLARFDCCLSRDVEPRPLFKRGNLRYNADTYFQWVNALPEGLKKAIREKSPDRDTIV